ncbi:MAG: hypothetical protein WBX10_22485, partial [Candidatus Sulfotelmatobacter sp.]
GLSYAGQSFVSFWCRCLLKLLRRDQTRSRDLILNHDPSMYSHVIIERLQTNYPHLRVHLQPARLRAGSYSVGDQTAMKEIENFTLILGMRLSQRCLRKEKTSK